jgi:hypothetical protein
MTKKKVRCFKTFANVYPTVFNYPVYYLTYDGFSNFSLATCTNCSELFVIDRENPETEGRSLVQIVGKQICPKCGLPLMKTIKKYPETIRLSNGKIGSFNPGNYIPPDHESLVLNIWEIIP